MERCTESIQENPMLATLVAFGVGLGFGAMIGAVLAEPAGLGHRRTAETVGRRVLDSLTHALPDSVRQHIAS